MWARDWFDARGLVSCDCPIVFELDGPVRTLKVAWQLGNAISHAHPRS